MAIEQADIIRHRDIARVWIVGYYSAKSYDGIAGYETHKARLNALAKIRYAKRLAGKPITSRNYQEELSPRGLTAFLWNKQLAKWDAYEKAQWAEINAKLEAAR